MMLQRKQWEHSQRLENGQTNMGNMHSRIPTRNTNSQPEPVRIIGQVIPANVTEIDYDVNSNPLYLGKAVPGTATSSPLWQIRKFTYDINSNLTVIQFANGTNDFTQIWDNRASLPYS